MIGGYVRKRHNNKNREGLGKRRTYKKTNYRKKLKKTFKKTFKKHKVRRRRR